MKNYERETFALQDGNGNLIGIDYDSGGYPWVPDGIGRAWFSAIKPKESYLRSFPELKLVRVKITVEEVSETDIKNGV
jgi:hypothetical protein